MLSQAAVHLLAQTVVGAEGARLPALFSRRLAPAAARAVAAVAAGAGRQRTGIQLQRKGNPVPCKRGWHAE